ncbi:hypothetical protein [Rhodopirellula sp. SWK7]|uniref:hypothetical protein n=1 Tax=Rhodopirellula sp. SWK7 TaxID=595460 RepID=UPI0002BF5AEE|nr:hypothetical protein [Rhodopirellula sp. SWK7]EMI45453.1 signal peptide protein [Rhodopirellula sp. SWK7]
MVNKQYATTLALLALTVLGGCASLNDCCYEKTQSVRAIKEYIKCGNPESSCYPHDYKCGWIDGFYEVATGGESCPPAVAPARYYKPEQILKHCDRKRHAYYSGWQDGASRASQFPDTHYLRIYETCECPFPRCDKPCGDGTCGPCTVAFVGMVASEDMIEASPTGDHNNEYIDQEFVVPAEPNLNEPTDLPPATQSPMVDELPSVPASPPHVIPAPNPDASTQFNPPFVVPENSHLSMMNGSDATLDSESTSLAMADSNHEFVPANGSPSQKSGENESLSAFNDDFVMTSTGTASVQAEETNSDQPIQAKSVGFIQLLKLGK